MPMKTNEREYRDFSLSAPEKEEDKKMVVGYACVFNHPYTLYEDSDMVIQEQVDSKAFDGADMTDVIFQYNHQGRVFARTKNNTLTVMPDNDGLRVEANLGETDIGNQLYQEIKGGYTSQMSYGYTVKEEKWEDNKLDDGRSLELRTITAINKVYDVSAVSIPANDATTISVRDLSNGVIEKIKAERLEALKIARKRLQVKIKMGGLNNV